MTEHNLTGVNQDFRDSGGVSSKILEKGLEPQVQPKEPVQPKTKPVTNLAPSTK